MAWDNGCAPAPSQPIIAAPFNAAAQRNEGATVPPLADWSPLLIQTRSVLGGTYWLVSSISAIFTVTNPPQDPPFGPGAGPASGLFLCPTADVGETLAQAQAGLNLTTRAVVLDVDIDNVLLPGSGLYVTSFVWRSGAGPLIVPQDWTIVAIVCPHPGTVTPGPGPGSFGSLSALVSGQRQ